VASTVNSELGLDVRADGGYVIAPPSMHRSGKPYEWAESLTPWQVEVEELLPWMLEYIGKDGKQKAKKQRGWETDALKGVGKGSRNQTAASLAGRYFSKGLSEEEVAQLLLTWNKSNRPPLPESEITRTVQSIHSRHKQNHPQPDKSNQFPDIMSGVAGEFAALYSSHLEVPSHFLYMGFLACLGIVVADRLTLASEVRPQPRLYVVLLGESADDRKSTALLKVTEFFRDAVDGFHVCWGVGSAEGLQERLEESNQLLLCFDELKQFISKCKIKTSVLLPCVNTLFESNRYENRTKQSDVRIENAYLTLLAASTIQTYENTWTSQFTDIGFNNRLFLVPGTGERRFPIPAMIPEANKQQLQRGLAEILGHVGPRLELHRTPAATDLYARWYKARPKSIHAKRLDTYAMRFMTLLAVNELKQEVDEQVVRQVISLCDWQYQVRELHDPIDADNSVAKMEESIRRNLRTKGPLKDWELKRGVNAHKAGLWAYDKAKKNLEKAEELGRNKKDKRYFLKHE
jgi:hypothetical protein